MKKFIILLFVLALVNVANAGIVDIVISSLNGEAINPVKEITIVPSDVINMDVIYTDDSGLTLFGMAFDVVAEGPGELSGDEPTWPVGVWDMLITEIIPHDGMIGVSGGAAGMGLPGGIAVDHLLMHCLAIGDVYVSLVNNTGLPAGDSLEVNADFSIMQRPEFGPGVVIHQIIPEPMTLTLLGLGGLFLVRRKK